MKWFEMGRKAHQKIKFGSFAVNWTFRGETGHRNVARNGSFTFLQVPYNQNIMHSAMLNLIAYAEPSLSDASGRRGLVTLFLFALLFMLSSYIELFLVVKFSLRLTV